MNASETMTVRDWFAMAAAEGAVEKAFSDELLARFGGDCSAVAAAIAEGAYLIADAMLLRRRRGPAATAAAAAEEDAPDARRAVAALLATGYGAGDGLDGLSAGWTAGQRREAWEWAMREHLAALGRRDGEEAAAPLPRLPRPEFLPEPRP